MELRSKGKSNLPDPIDLIEDKSSFSEINLLFLHQGQDIKFYQLFYIFNLNSSCYRERVKITK